MNNIKALIIVDLNNDFMPGGALAAPDAEGLLPVINNLAARGNYAIVVATQDWHPADHVSFDEWPPHCVAGERGAELHPELEMANIDAVIRKGFDPHVDSYSGFYNSRGETNGLAELLHARDVMAVDIVGIATDYCVKHTAIDAATKGDFTTRVLLQGCRGIGLEPNDIPEAIEAMRQAGVEIVMEVN